MKSFQQRVLEEALQHISEQLPCDRPCRNLGREQRVECSACGHAHGASFCAGCVARAALEKAKDAKE